MGAGRRGLGSKGRYCRNGVAAPEDDGIVGDVAGSRASEDDRTGGNVDDDDVLGDTADSCSSEERGRDSEGSEKAFLRRWVVDSWSDKDGIFLGIKAFDWAGDAKGLRVFHGILAAPAVIKSTQGNAGVAGLLGWVGMCADDDEVGI